MKHFTAKLSVSSVFTLFVIYVFFAGKYSLPLFSFISPCVNPAAYQVSMLILTIPVLLCAGELLIDGIVSSFKFNFDYNFLTVMSLVVTLLYDAHIVYHISSGNHEYLFSYYFVLPAVILLLRIINEEIRLSGQYKINDILKKVRVYRRPNESQSAAFVQYVIENYASVILTVGVIALLGWLLNLETIDVAFETFVAVLLIFSSTQLDYLNIILKTDADDVHITKAVNDLANGSILFNALGIVTAAGAFHIFGGAVLNPIVCVALTTLNSAGSYLYLQKLEKDVDISYGIKPQNENETN